MKAGSSFFRVFAANAIVGPALWSQAAAAISLAQAQQIALRNHPRIASAKLAAEASAFVVKQVRSAYYPTLSGNVTGVGTEHGSVLSAGAVTTSSIYSRQASGVVANQLLTDFGRTSSLEQSAKLRDAAENQKVTNTRAQVLIEVQQSYYRALASESIFESGPGDAGSSAADASASKCTCQKLSPVHRGRELRPGERITS